MSKDFFSKRFDDATNVKLDIFRLYIREWLPVFMTRQKGGFNHTTDINIYDFFAGAGRDGEGNPGSPLIIVDEIKKYCRNNKGLKANVSVRMLFNDIKRRYISSLEKNVQSVQCDRDCCRIEYSVSPFHKALNAHLEKLNSRTNASLVILDQFGIKDVTPEIVQELASCETTDILFFISTSFIRRFIETPEIGNKYDLNKEDLKNKEYNVIHRHLCNHYREKLKEKTYYLAPFSIKKGSNIYGVIFGSSHLLGLEKFLKVCWSLDKTTGEANYNIDGDFSWRGQPSLFEQLNRIKKIDLFKHELREYITSKRPNNIELHEFCLVKGFPPFKASEVLRDLQKKEKLTVWNLKNDTRARNGAFYLGWKNCRSDIPKACFSFEGAQ